MKMLLEASYNSMQRKDGSPRMNIKLSPTSIKENNKILGKDNSYELSK
jgi:hypothetical protein